jgi:septum formation protein
MSRLEILDKLNTYDIILASQSPRRQYLLRELGIRFRIVDHLDMDEAYPSILQAGEIPVYLARAKASFFERNLGMNSILVTADTIVWLDGEVIGKPVSSADAFDMLKRLSGRMHEVYTGVCIKTMTRESVFQAVSSVYFRNLTDGEIRYYIDQWNPTDKAGAYGIQEWIGYVGVERIEGSYYNVMGLPVQPLYDELTKLIADIP